MGNAQKFGSEVHRVQEKRYRLCPEPLERRVRWGMGGSSTSHRLSGGSSVGMAALRLAIRWPGGADAAVALAGGPGRGVT